MPTASDIQKLGAAQRRSSEPHAHDGRAFRERLLDFATEYEALQGRFDALVLGNQELKVKNELLSDKIGRLESEQPEEGAKDADVQAKEKAKQEAFEREAEELRGRVSELTSELREQRGLVQERTDELLELRQASKTSRRRQEELEKEAETSAGEAKRRQETLKKQEEALQQAEEELQEERRSADAKIKALDEERRQADLRAQRAEEDLRALTKELTAAKAASSQATSAREPSENGRRGRSPSPPAAAQTEPEGRVESLATQAPAAAKPQAEERQIPSRDSAVANGTSNGAARAKEAVQSGAKNGKEVEKEAERKAPKEVQRKAPKVTKANVALAAHDAAEGRSDKLLRESLPNVGALEQHDWFGLYEHSPTAKARVFVFYGAGSKASALWSWQRAMKTQYPELEMVVFEYPGHGKHEGQPISDMDVFEEEFTSQVIQHREGYRKYFNCPFAVVGFSAGARVGMSVMRILSKYGVQTKKFYAIGRPPPVSTVDFPLPADSGSFFKMVAEKIVPSKAEVFKALMQEKTPRQRMAEENIWRSDLALNNSIANAMPRRWIVGRSGKLLKRKDLDSTKTVCINRPPGSECFVTGEEHRIGQDRWLQIDTERDPVKPGWWCVQGHAVGERHDLLELPEDWESDPVDQDSVFERAAVPFQIHFSNTDDIAVASTMSEWSRLTAMEPEFVEHDRLLHDELLAADDVFKFIMDDFSTICRLR